MRKRADRAFADRPIVDAVIKVRAIVGPVSFAGAGLGEDELVALAEEGLEALRNDQEPTARQFQALVVLIQLTRPAVPSRGGLLGPLPEYERADPDEQAARQQAWKRFSDRLRPYLYSIGRIDSGTGDRNWGTGFLVRPGLLLTNKHVLFQAAAGSDRLEPGQLQVNFRQEWHETDSENPLPVLSVLRVHATLDMALLEIPENPERPAVPFAASPPVEGSEVVAIGYPYEDVANSPQMMDRIYEGRYGVKQAAPGEVIEVAGDHFSHDCSTLGGNSGSPVLALASGQVVGLHRSGYFAWRNQAVIGAAVSEFIQP